uniref:Tropinone reductase-like 1 n=1 Tax=Quercus lobata TaxID=97700 RepID=A0A7N2N8L1_QUELO
MLRIAPTSKPQLQPGEGGWLDGKVAIITGGASGIGASTVHLFHEHGANVVIADVQDNLGQEIADKLGKNVSYIHCDVTNEDDICNRIDTTVAKHGQLDIMYNNAGIIDCPSPLGRILDTKKSDLERTISVNLVGSFLGAKHAARVMVPQRKGCILFTSAATAIAGISIVGTGMSSEMSESDKSQAEDALSNLVGNLKGQILKAEDVARAALYLASDEANYISGLNLLVDGGYSVVNPNMVNIFSAFMG